MQSPVSVSEQIYFTVSTAGHVDHGKTSLLRALTGIDPDRLKEEKERQMTTDLGFAHLRVSASKSGIDREVVVGFVDVPGHGKFLKNMLAGVGGLDMALLVVAADEGPMPQTIQHVKILSLLGTRKCLAVITKTDVVGESRQDEVTEEVRRLLATFEIDCVGAVGVSSTKRVGLDQLQETLVTQLIALPDRELRHVRTKGSIVEPQTRSDGERSKSDGERSKSDGESGLDEPSLNAAFLPIDRVFSKSGYGVVITGTLVRGSMTPNQSLFIEPGGIKARVRGLETFNKSIKLAVAGQRLAVNLALKDNKTLERGQVLMGAPVSTTTMLIVQLEQFADEQSQLDSKDLQNQQIRLYHGTAECAGHIRWVESVPGESATKFIYIGQIALSDPLVAEPDDRFVVRLGDEGIIGGTILLTARPRWLTRQKLDEFWELKQKRKTFELIQFYVNASPQKLLQRSALGSFLRYAAADEIVERMAAEHRLVRLGDHITTPEGSADLEARFLKALTKGTAAPDTAAHEQADVSLEHIRSKSLFGMDRNAFQQLIKNLTDSGKIVRKGDRVALPGLQASPETVSDLARNGEKIETILAEHLCLELDEIARLAGFDKKKMSATMKYLAEHDRAHIVGYEFASNRESLNKAHQVLADLWAEKRDIAPGDFRERLGVSRKYAMALLAHFDDKLITRRMSAGRVLLKAPPK